MSCNQTSLQRTGSYRAHRFANGMHADQCGHNSASPSWLHSTSSNKLAVQDNYLGWMEYLSFKPPLLSCMSGASGLQERSKPFSVTSRLVHFISLIDCCNDIWTVEQARWSVVAWPHLNPSPEVNVLSMFALFGRRSRSAFYHLCSSSALLLLFLTTKQLLLFRPPTTHTPSATPSPSRTVSGYFSLGYAFIC